MDVVILVVTEQGEKRARFKPGGKFCPHLSFEGDMASCGVHSLPEYEGSPCWVYGNPDVDPDFIAKKGMPCLVGLNVKKTGHLNVLQSQLEHPSVDDLEDLGLWPERED